MKCGCDDKRNGGIPVRLTIQKPNDAATPGVSGHIDLSDDDNWLNVATVRGTVMTRGGRESWRFSQVSAEVTRIVKVPSTRLTRSIQPRWRLRHRQDGEWQTWDIGAAYDVNAEGRTVEIYCVETVEAT